MALPSTGKTFASFQQDDAACKSYAAQLVGPVATSADTLATAALLGTALEREQARDWERWAAPQVPERPSGAPPA